MNRQDKLARLRMKRAELGQMVTPSVYILLISILPMPVSILALEDSIISKSIGICAIGCTLLFGGLGLTGLVHGIVGSYQVDRQIEDLMKNKL